LVGAVGRVARGGWAEGRGRARGGGGGGGEIFRTYPEQPWGPPSLLYNGYRVFSGGKERPGRDAAPHPLLVLWSRKSRTIPLLPLWTIRPVQSLSACTRVYFFTLYLCVLYLSQQVATFGPYSVN
jgi:hypothetical protein